MAVTLVVQLIVTFACGTLVSSEVPYPYSESTPSASSVVSRTSGAGSPTGNVAAAVNAAREAAAMLKDSATQSASEDALEEAALTEAAMTDDSIGVGAKLDETKIKEMVPAQSLYPESDAHSKLKEMIDPVSVPAAPAPVPVGGEAKKVPVRAHFLGAAPSTAPSPGPSSVPSPSNISIVMSGSNASVSVLAAPSPLAPVADIADIADVIDAAPVASVAPVASLPPLEVVAPIAPVAFGIAARANSSAATAVTGMEKAITDMMLGNIASFGATPFGKSVSQITDLIEKDMMPKVLAAHTANQRELDKLIHQVHDCTKTKNFGIGKANKKKAIYLKMSPLHKTCRSGEAGQHTEKVECNNELRDKSGLMRLKCKEFAFVYKKYGDQNANRQIVKKAGMEHTETYLKRITSTMCGKYPPGGKGGGGKDGFLDLYMVAKEACNRATVNFKAQQKKCHRITKEYRAKKKTCDNIQDEMDDSSCKRAVEMKDACETYAECYYDKKKIYTDTEKMVRLEEKDRQAEWRGLKRMQCLMTSFDDGKVSSKEVDDCKKKSYDVGHLVIKYPKIPELAVCSVPLRYPSTAEYKLAEFSPLPSMAKGRSDANECTGVIEISVTPHKKSPKTCKCERMTLNGPYSAGPLVKCSKCLEIRRSQDTNSCPEGTKLFSPRSDSDWRTVFSSVGKLQDPYFIVDVTRPQNGCGGCTRKPMHSGTGGQGFYWQTQDGSPWWLRSNTYKAPNGNYHANCYMAMFKPWKPENLKFDDDGCKFYSKSYYCQLRHVSTTPKKGSPSSCQCEKLALTGTYSAGALIKCTGCWRVSKSTQKNSCPAGTKLFSPASARDWKTVLASADPLRSPSWIVDVTRPQNGCGGCTRNAMNSKVAAQGTWRTSDGSAWWLRSTKYSEPNGDYFANCYLDLWKTPANENSIMFNDHKCKHNSNAYYCQPVGKRASRR